MNTRVALSGTKVAGGLSRPISASFVGGLVRLCDTLVVGAWGLAIYLLYVYPQVGSFSSQYLTTVIVAMLVATANFQWFGVYEGDYLFTPRLRIDRMLSAWVVTICVLLAVAFTLKVTHDYSRLWALTWFAASFATLAAGRLVLGHRIGRLARQGRFANRTVILGAGDNGRRLAEHLNAEGDPRIRIVGFVDDRRDRVPPESQGYEVLGDIDHLIHLIRRNLVDQVFIALPWSAENRVHELIQRLALTPVVIRLAPDLVGFGLRDREFSHVSGLSMLHVFDRPISGWSQLTKSAEDKLLAGTLLLFLAPLMLVIAAAIKLDSRGPVFFRQRRYGFNHELIAVWKFRTMYHHLADPDATVAVVREDPRVTRVGRFLRRSSLDELPQLFNVMTGEMSLVGPRPHALDTKAAGHYCDQVVEAYAARHKVKPGITGWAQVNGWRGELDSVEKIERRVEHDLYYIDHWSVWFDLMILLKTLVLILRDENAY